LNSVRPPSRSGVRVTLWQVAAALAAATGPLAAGESSQDAGTVFEGRRDQLSTVGVHRAEGFVFSAFRQSMEPAASERFRDAAKAKAEIRAVRQMVEWFIGERSLAGIDSGPLRQALQVAGGSCVDGVIDMQGLTTVLSDAGSDSILVVRAVPEARLEAISLDRKSLRKCLLDRVMSGQGRAVDVLLAEELRDGSDVPERADRDAFVSALAAAVGPGIELSLAGRWAGEGRAICAECLSGWSSPAADAVASTGSCGGILGSMPFESVRDRSVDDLLQFAAVRVNDQSVRRALNLRLVSDGYARSVRLLQLAAGGPVPFDDRPGSRLERTVRARVFASPVVIAMLLTDGTLDVAWGPAPACLTEATAAFDEGTPESVSRSIVLLLDGMGIVPNADALSLLSAALLASDEARVAEPLARAAFLAMPEHKFAGVNALRAQRALGLKDRATALFPRVAAESKLGSWGRRQLQSIAEWLGVSVQPVPAPGGAARED